MAKATRQTTQPAFVPVVLTLETQDEVDAIFDALVDQYSFAAEGTESETDRNKLNHGLRKALRPFLG